jgi:EmrB/QacA subfamily drug resistance transporter
MLALFLAALDQTIVATALPRIVEDLNGLDRYAWVASAYLLASTVLVPVYGKLADTLSRKTIEIFAVCAFLTGSILCGLAGEFGPLPLIGDGMNQLIAMRAVQGVGAAGLFAMAFIVIADLYPPRERGRYQGLIGAVFGVASVVGPLTGGFLTDHAGGVIPGVAGWRWVFYVNVPIGAVALWFLTTRMPKLEPGGERGRFDYLAAALLMAGLVPLVTALQLDRGVHPWGGATTVLLLLTAALMIPLFVLRTLRSADPLFDLTLFRERLFVTGNAALFLLGATFINVLVFLPLFLVNVIGVSATRAGASLIPLSLGVVFGATAAGQLVSRFGRYRMLMLGGGTVLIVGIFLLTRMTAATTYAQVTLVMVVCGVGIGPSMPLYTLAIQNGVRRDKLGQATSATQFFRQVGGTVGIALMGTVLATGLAALPPEAAGLMPGAAASVEGAVLPPPGTSEGAERMLADTPPGIEADMAVRAAFADAIAGIFRYVLAFAALAWVATWFVPEHTLAAVHPEDILIVD